MFTIVKIINTLFVLTLLTACGEKTQTVEWYLEHKDILNKEYEKCKKKTFEEIVKDKHCQVVEQARQKAFNEHQRNAPIPKFDPNDFK